MRQSRPLADSVAAPVVQPERQSVSVSVRAPRADYLWAPAVSERIGRRFFYSTYGYESAEIEHG